MTKKYSDHELKMIALQRFNSFNWEISTSNEGDDAFYASLPPRGENESVPEWLRRALLSVNTDLPEPIRDNVVPMPVRPIYITESFLTRRAAADGKLAKLERHTDDERFYIEATQLADHIHVKVETTGQAIDYLIKKGAQQIEITNRALDGMYKITVPISLPYLEGNVDVPDDETNRQLLFSPDTTLIIRAL